MSASPTAPLKSYLGTVDDIDMEHEKVRIVVSMFGRETPWSWTWIRSSLWKRKLSGETSRGTVPHAMPGMAYPPHVGGVLQTPFQPHLS